MSPEGLKPEHNEGERLRRNIKPHFRGLLNYLREQKINLEDFMRSFRSVDLDLDTSEQVKDIQGVTRMDVKSLYHESKVPPIDRDHSKREVPKREVPKGNSNIPLYSNVPMCFGLIAIAILIMSQVIERRSVSKDAVDCLNSDIKRTNSKPGVFFSTHDNDEMLTSCGLGSLTSQQLAELYGIIAGVDFIRCIEEEISSFSDKEKMDAYWSRLKQENSDGQMIPKFEIPVGDKCYPHSAYYNTVSARNALRDRYDAKIKQLLLRPLRLKTESH